MTLSRTALTVAAALVVTGGLITAAQATPSSGPPTVATNAASGLLDGTNRPARWTQDGVQLKTSRPTTVRTFTLTYPVGSDSGWHSHPGIVVAVVAAGTVERRTACGTDTFTVGDAFIEVGPHRVSNAGAVDAVLSITRIYPTSGESTPRIDEAAPACS